MFCLLALLLPACDGTSDKAAESVDGDLDGSPEAPDCDDADADCDGVTDVEHDPCAQSYGRVGLDANSVQLSPSADASVVTMYGLAYLCEVTCSESWLTATVGDFDPTCVAGAMPLPWNMTRNGTICVHADDPGVASAGSCTVRSSVGELTVQVAWGE